MCVLLFLNLRGPKIAAKILKIFGFFKVPFEKFIHIICSSLQRGLHRQINCFTSAQHKEASFLGQDSAIHLVSQGQGTLDGWVGQQPTSDLSDPEGVYKFTEMKFLDSAAFSQRWNGTTLIFSC